MMILLLVTTAFATAATAMATAATSPLRTDVARLLLDATEATTCHENVAGAILAARARSGAEGGAVSPLNSVVELAAAVCLSPPHHAQLNRERAASKYARLLETLVISLLAFRSPATQLRLHLFLDAEAAAHPRVEVLVRRFADTAKRGFSIVTRRVDAPEVEKLLLPAERQLRHGLHECAYLSALAPRLFGVEIAKLIWLDIDLVFLDSAAKLWSQFDVFDATQLIGVAAEQTPYYLTERVSWPVLGGVGLNTGVQLLKLAAMRDAGFTASQWLPYVERIMAEGACSPGQRGSTCLGLADQDVINAMLEQAPSRLYQLHCSWNAQLILLSSRRKDMAQPCLARLGGGAAAGGEGGRDAALGVRVLHGNGGSFFASATKRNADYGGGTRFAAVHAVVDELVDVAGLWDALLNKNSSYGAQS